VIFSCSTESPFMSKEEAHRLVEEINIDRDPFHAIQHVAAIIDNDIYYFKRLDSIPVKLTNSSSLQKTHVKLSPDHAKIAYLNENGNPVIISTENGAVLETLTEYSYIEQMDWVKNTTLYLLLENQVVFYGPSVSVTQPEIYHYWDDVSSFSMNSIGDQGYAVHRYNTGRQLEYHSTSKNIDEEYSNVDGYSYDYIDFYDDNGSFMLGEKDYYSEEAMNRIICLEDYQTYASYEWDGDDLMYTPKFNGEHEVLVYGVYEANAYYVKAVYLGTDAYEGSGLYDRLMTTFTNYPSTTPIYVDWAQ
jgi:hypothetical protein